MYYLRVEVKWWKKHSVFAIEEAPTYPFSRAGAPYLITVPGRIGPVGLPTQKPTPGPLAAALYLYY